MSTTHQKGVTIPTSGDDLLDAWSTAMDTAGIIQPTSSISAMRAALTAMEVAGTLPTAGHPAYFDMNGMVYRSTGTKGTDNVYDLVPINMIEGHEEAGAGLTVTRTAGSQHEFIKSKLPVRPYRRMVMAFGMANASVTGTVGLRVLINNREGLTARWENNASQQTQFAMNMGFVEANTDPKVILAASFGGTGNSTVAFSSAADANRLDVLAFPVTMA